MSFHYDHQDDWCDGTTLNMKRQSPIDIFTKDVKIDKNLKPLQLSPEWGQPCDGELVNTGHSVQFNPPSNFVPTITTSFGTYEFLQVHYHWGKKLGEGSEHLIDGKSTELEVHCVHKKQGATDSTAGDFLAVIGIFAEVNKDAPLNDLWEQLDVSAIQTGKQSTPLSGLRLDKFLPKNLDYYYYPGSLTTPPCSETVQWFVLKEKINISEAYLKQLRQLKGSEGEEITNNFRKIQNLAGRTVSTNQS